MINLNASMGASMFLEQHAKQLLDMFQEQLCGAEMGVAYGGGVEAIAKIWEGRGVVHGFDTFEKHPRHLAISPKDPSAWCMDVPYYNYGEAGLSIEEQQAELKRNNVTNVILHKGLINDDSLKGIDKLHYVLLDMDIPNSMMLGYKLVESKIVPGGYMPMR